MNTQEKIKKLETEIKALKQKQINGFIAKILPFIRKYGRCSYHHSGQIYIEFDDKDREQEFVKILEKGAGDNAGWNHFGVSAGDASVLIRYDDGRITLQIAFSGKTETLLERIHEKMKQLKLRIDFNNEIIRCQNNVTKEKEKLNFILKLAKEFGI